MKTVVALTLLTFFFISACNSGLSKHRKHSKKYPPKDRVSIEQLTPMPKPNKGKLKNQKKQKKKKKNQLKKQTNPSGNNNQ